MEVEKGIPEVETTVLLPGLFGVETFDEIQQGFVAFRNDEFVNVYHENVLEPVHITVQTVIQGSENIFCSDFYFRFEIQFPRQESYDIIIDIIFENARYLRADRVVVERKMFHPKYTIKFYKLNYLIDFVILVKWFDAHGETFFRRFVF